MDCKKDQVEASPPEAKERTPSSVAALEEFHIPRRNRTVTTPAVKKTNHAACAASSPPLTTSAAQELAIVSPEKSQAKKSRIDANEDKRNPLNLGDSTPRLERSLPPIAQATIKEEPPAVPEEQQQTYVEPATTETKEETPPGLKEDNELQDTISGETVMGFPKYPQTTNRDIMLKHIGFVHWARNLQDPQGRLVSFLAWANSEEGKRLEVEGQGNEEFGFGQHKGETFREIAASDPKYHVRYFHMLKKKQQEPSDILVRYRKWFNSSRRKKTNRGNKPETMNRSSSRTTPSSLRGNERFPFGQHRGETFRQVALIDPSYHLRYMAMNHNPPPVIARYTRYYERYDPGNHLAHQAHRYDLASFAGIGPPSWTCCDCGSDEEDDWYMY